MEDHSFQYSCFGIYLNGRHTSKVIDFKHVSDGKTIPVVSPVTIRFIGGSSAPAKEDWFFVLDNFSCRIHHPKISCDFQWTSFIYFKKGIYVFHDRKISR